MKTLGLSLLVAVATLIAMAIVGFGFFVSGGIIFQRSWHGRLRRRRSRVIDVGALASSATSRYNPGS